MYRLNVIVVPTASKWVGRQPIVITLVYQVAEKLERYPVVSNDAKSLVMCKREMVTRRMFRKLVDALTAGEIESSLSWRGLSEYGVVDKLVATASPKRARTMSPRRAHGTSHDDAR